MKMGALIIILIIAFLAALTLIDQPTATQSAAGIINVETLGVPPANGQDELSGMMPVAEDSDDDRWSSQFNLPGTDSGVRDLVTDGTGNLYAGGSFTTVADVYANRIAKWDGSSWSALGDGIEGGYEPTVSALAVDGAGNLYAGGSFTTAGGVPADNIAMWDGSSWSALGTGIDGGVSALAVDGAGNLYAGGYFSTAGGVPASNVAMWDGSSWSALGTGIDGGVSALAVDGAGNLYVGGSFTFLMAGGQPIHYGAMWDGSSWSALGSGLVYVFMNGYVNDLAVDDQGILYVSGFFCLSEPCTGPTSHRLAKWDGSNWSALDAGFDGGNPSWGISSLTVDGAGILYTGGSFTTAGGVPANHIAKWDGSSWSALGSGLDGGASNLALDGAGNLYASTIFSATWKVIVKWDGSSWSSLTPGYGLNDRVGALAADEAGNVYAGGGFHTAGNLPVNHIAKWDGNNWSALGTGIDGGVSALAVDTAGNIYAGASHIAEWDGNGWSALGTGFDREGVRAIVLDEDGNLYAGGCFTMAGGVPASRVAKWDGNSWSALGDGRWECVNALAVDKTGNLYAGDEAGLVAMWDGNSWSDLGSDFAGGSVDALALDADGDLYAGGWEWGAPGYHIARWDGSSWTALGTNFNGRISALALDTEGNVYAGGSFTEAGSDPANCIAKWDGNSWLAMGSGLYNDWDCGGGVKAIEVDRDRYLFVGGNFLSAGGKPSWHIARWSMDAKAAFEAAPTSGRPPLTVQFDNLSTGDFATCSWEFGDDGVSSSCEDPDHIYTAAGTYTVTLTVSGLGGSAMVIEVDYIMVENFEVYIPTMMKADLAG